MPAHSEISLKVQTWQCKILRQRLIIAGTTDLEKLETYCETVGLEKYDNFLILNADRFFAYDLMLAKTVKSMKKSFFFVRTKIDVNIKSESRKKSFNEESTLNEIRKDCCDNLKDLVVRNEDVFLISNHEKDKWDFDRLTQAILDVLPLRQKETLTLSLDLLTSRSKNLLKRKVEVLRGNYIFFLNKKILRSFFSG